MYFFSINRIVLIIKLNTPFSDGRCAENNGFLKIWYNQKFVRKKPIVDVKIKQTNGVCLNQFTRNQYRFRFS